MVRILYVYVAYLDKGKVLLKHLRNTLKYAIKLDFINSITVDFVHKIKSAINKKKYNTIKISKKREKNTIFGITRGFRFHLSI